MLKLNKIGLGILMLSLLFPLTSHAQDFYKWVDANGSTHYTTTPPPKNAKQLGSVNTINDTPSGSNYVPPQTNNEVQNNENNQQPTTPSNNTAPTTGERIPLPPPQQDPTANQPIILNQGSNAAL